MSEYYIKIKNYSDKVIELCLYNLSGLLFSRLIETGYMCKEQNYTLSDKISDFIKYQFESININDEQFSSAFSNIYKLGDILSKILFFIINPRKQDFYLLKYSITNDTGFRKIYEDVTTVNWEEYENDYYVGLADDMLNGSENMSNVLINLISEKKITQEEYMSHPSY